MRKGTSVHGGLRTKLFVGVLTLSCVLNSTDRFQGPKDYEIDRDVVGFTIIEAHEIDDIGMNGIIEKVRKAVGDTPVYLSIDIDGNLPPTFQSQSKRLIGFNECSPGSQYCSGNGHPRVRRLDYP